MPCCVPSTTLSDADPPTETTPAASTGAAEVATAAVRIVQALERLGVPVAFGLPGVHNLAIWKALSESSIRLVGVRHEQAAVYAADGYARATGRLGVAVVTTGPGAANTLGATGEAMASGSPVLVIATDIPAAIRRPDTYRGSLHETRDQTAMFAPVTKAATLVAAAAQIGDAVVAGRAHRARRAKRRRLPGRAHRPVAPARTRAPAAAARASIAPSAPPTRRPRSDFRSRSTRAAARFEDDPARAPLRHRSRNRRSTPIDHMLNVSTRSRGRSCTSCCAARRRSARPNSGSSSS